MIPRFYTSLLFLTAYLFNSNNSMPSLKDRYLLRPGRRIKPSEVMPDEMDEDILEDMVHEVPELKTYLRRRDKLRDKRVPFNHKVFFTTSTEVISYYDDLEADYDSTWWNEEGTDTLREPIDNLPYETTNKPNTTTNRIPFVTRWPDINPPHKAPSRRNADQYFRQSRVIKCYQCGLYGHKVPNSSLCSDAFADDSAHGKYRSVRNKLRIQCHSRKSERSDGTITYGTMYQWNRGLRRTRSGPFMGGCFKRYLDVGNIYTVRGCRSWPPWKGSHCTGIRFKRLEMTLRSKANGCIASPSASLTPFHRSISLFARYHVCVCNREYCNGVGKHDDAFALLLTVFITLHIVI